MLPSQRVQQTPRHLVSTAPPDRPPTRYPRYFNQHPSPPSDIQLIALRYGAVPVVRATGGLADTVHDVDADPASGNGYSFAGTDEGSLDSALHRAFARYRDDRPGWDALARRNMTADVSWCAPAAEYVHIYRTSLAAADEGV